MADNNQAQEMARAADKFTEAAHELTGALNRFLDFQQSLEGRREHYGWRGDPWAPRRGTLSEEESVALALRAVQEAREENPQGLDSGDEGRLPTPSPDEVRKRREDRRRREAAEGDS